MTMKKQIYSAAKMDRAIGGMAAAIAAAFPIAEGTCALVGIHQLGVPLAAGIGGRARDRILRADAGKEEVRR